MIVLFGVGSKTKILGQNAGPNLPDEKNKKSSDPAKETKTPTAQPSNIKVTFDETAPDVLIIESNGEKVRVDVAKKTVEKVNETANVQPTAEAPTANSKQQKETEAEEDLYDFEPGFEPYDYHLINLPTPKSVPKGTWNMSFSHRFSQPLRPFSESGRELLGFDSMSASSFGMSYGITDKLYLNAYRSPLCQRGLCKTIELGVGYHWLNQKGKSPVAFTTYASIEGNDNFTEEYTYNFQAMIARSIGKRVYLFFAPAVHINANGQRRFNPRPDDYFPVATVADTFRLPKHGASFGFGTAVMITPTLLALFEYTPRVGFKLGRVDPIFDANFNVVGFNNVSEPSIGFGIQKNIGKHSFTITISNTQTSTTSRYNSSNLVMSPKNYVIGFNLFRRW